MATLLYHKACNMVQLLYNCTDLRNLIEHFHYQKIQTYSFLQKKATSLEGGRKIIDYQLKKVNYL